MADSKISALPVATTPLGGTEVLPIVQSSTTKQVSVANLTAGRAISASSVTNTALTSGRVTYAGASGVLTDSANLVFTGSSLGIGVASPNQLLQLGNATAVEFDMFIGATRTGTIYVDNSQMIFVAVPAIGMYFKTNDTNRMLIGGDGIITMNAYGAGAATFSASGVISSVSDETWKIKDGVPVNPEEMLQKLEPGYWFYNEEKAPTFGKERQLGFYAQNVHEAIGEEAAPTPEKHKDNDGNDTDVTKPWGYYDRSVLAVAVMSLKNALSTIEELKQRIEVLENK